FGDFLDDFVFNMQNAPSILTGKLLAELEARAAAEDEGARERVRAIQEAWGTREKARNLLRLMPGTNLPVRGVFDLNPASGRFLAVCLPMAVIADRKSTRLNSSHVAISYAVFCLKKKTRRQTSSKHPSDRS